MIEHYSLRAGSLDRLGKHRSESSARAQRIHVLSEYMYTLGIVGDCLYIGINGGDKDIDIVLYRYTVNDLRERKHFVPVHKALRSDLEERRFDLKALIHIRISFRYTKHRTHFRLPFTVPNIRDAHKLLIRIYFTTSKRQLQVYRKNNFIF